MRRHAVSVVGQSQRGGQPRGAAADDQDIDVEVSRCTMALILFRGLRELRDFVGPGGYFWSSATIAGTISNRSPTMP